MLNGSANDASPRTQTRLDDLMRRLDKTLGSDGQLI
jgi:hypothetical protein